MGPLQNNSRVVIIGGGPAGSACALALKRKAAQLNRNLEVILIEGKQFAGELHHNQCVGVLSPPLPQLMEDELGIPFPNQLSKTEITGYVLHSKEEEITLDSSVEPSIAVRRVQFDEYMLNQVKEHGVTVLSARAVDVEFNQEGVVIYTENAPVQADVVVGAFGLDDGSGALFERACEYKPPKALSAVVMKYHPDEEVMKASGNRIHAFLPAHRQIEFGGITPKGDHLTINIAGKSVNSHLMWDFLKMPQVSYLIDNLERFGKNNSNDVRFFKGRFPCTLARNYYGDRYVMIGDAAGLVRSFKGNGVTSGVQTGVRAAKAMLLTGISKEAFHDDYRRANDDIISDLPYGRIMRYFTINLARYGLLDSVIRAARTDLGLQGALLGAVSAHIPYKPVLFDSLQPGRMFGVLRALRK